MAGLEVVAALVGEHRPAIGSALERLNEPFPRAAKRYLVAAREQAR